MAPIVVALYPYKRLGLFWVGGSLVPVRLGSLVPVGLGSLVPVSC